MNLRMFSGKLLFRATFPSFLYHRKGVRKSVLDSGRGQPLLALAGLPVNGAGPDLEQDGRGEELALGVVELGLPGVEAGQQGSGGVAACPDQPGPQQEKQPGPQPGPRHDRGIPPQGAGAGVEECELQPPRPAASHPPSSSRY